MFLHSRFCNQIHPEKNLLKRTRISFWTKFSRYWFSKRNCNKLTNSTHAWIIRLLSRTHNLLFYSSLKEKSLSLNSSSNFGFYSTDWERKQLVITFLKITSLRPKMELIWCKIFKNMFSFTFPYVLVQGNSHHIYAGNRAYKFHIS